MKKIFISMLCVLISISLVSCCFGYKEKVNIDELEFEEISYWDIFDEYRLNEARAEDIYVGRYVTFTGEITKVGEDSISMDVAYINPDDTVHYQCDIYCKKYSNDLDEVLLSLNRGDKVTVKGKIDDLSKTEISIKLYAVEKVE